MTSLRRAQRFVPAAVLLAAALAFVPVLLALDEAAPAAPRVRHYNDLGRTGLKVSDIGFGGGYCTDPAVVQYAFDQGITYFDTAESYASGRSEAAIGEVAARHRDKMVICTKMIMTGTTTEAEIREQLAASLARLRTSYVDVFMVHGATPEELGNPGILPVLDALKKEGKIRQRGVSHHGPNVSAAVRPLIEQGRVDVVLIAYNPAADPGIVETVRLAKERGVGLIGMKTMTAARQAQIEEFASGKLPFQVAALRWALTRTGCDSVILSFSLFDQIDEYLAVSGAAGA